MAAGPVPNLGGGLTAKAICSGKCVVKDYTNEGGACGTGCGDYETVGQPPPVCKQCCPPPNRPGAPG